MRYYLSAFLIVFGFFHAAVLLPATAQEQARPDTTGQGDMFLMSDTLTARYAGLERTQEGVPSGSALTGQLSYERTVFPLRHAGQNVFQPLFDDGRLFNIIQILKDNTAWDPFQPGITGNIPYDYNYDRDGATRNSHAVRASLERALQPSGRLGYRFDTRYRETWGPFPNQQTTRLDGLLNLSYRLSPSQEIKLGLLGLDNGWHARAGNRVYTDRARYILENLNLWRARTGGIDFQFNARPSENVTYRLQARILSDQWASDPPDPSLLTFPVFSQTPTFLDGVFPGTRPPVFAATRDYRTVLFGGEATYQANEVHLLSLGVETRFHNLRQSQFWQAQQTPDAFDLTIQPKELSLYLSDRLRFGRLLMDLGLRYDLYAPGNALWQDIYRTLGDDRGIQDAVRQLLINAGGAADNIHLLNPHISVSYPSRIWTAHMSFSVARQTPSFQDIFTYTDRSTSPFVDRSVTNLMPLRTTTLEGGIGIAKGIYTADVTAFYRDSERYLPVFGPEALPQSVSNYTGHWGRINLGLRRQGGIEAALIRRSAPIGRSRTRVSSRLSYMYLGDLGSVRSGDRPLGPGDPLSTGDFTTFDRSLNAFWNRRHWFSLIGTIRFPSGTVLSAVGQMQSGAPYRRPVATQIGQIVLPDQVGELATGPWTRRFDMRFDFPLIRKRSWPTTVLFVEVHNLLDEDIINVVADPRTFESSGEPDNPLLDQSQWIYGPARAVWTGIKFQW